MKKLFVAVLGAAFLFAMESGVKAEPVNVDELQLSVEVDFDVVSAEHLRDVGGENVTGDRLYALVTMNGIKPGEKFEYYFRWISPTDMFKSSDYPTAEERSNGKKNLFAGDDACAEPETRCQCYCKYEGEDAKKAKLKDGTIVRGCWRTRAYRTIEWTSDKGETHTATGTWRVEVVRVDGASETVLASSTFTVN